MRAQKASLRAEEMYDEAERDPVIGDDEEKRAEWEAGFRGIFELCEGKEKRILEVSEDWKEALAAWLIWVNVRARRKDLPYVRVSDCWERYHINLPNVRIVPPLRYC